jgi:uncharacterized membrane protein
MKIAKALLGSALVFLCVDIAWIAFFLRDVYDAEIGSMLLESPRPAGALLFYAGYIPAVVYFAVRPAWQTESAGIALGNGCFLGAVAYGTYTLTNFALFGAWSWLLVVSDIAWGSFLTAVAALAGYLLSRR